MEITVPIGGRVGFGTNLATKNEQFDLGKPRTTGSMTDIVEAPKHSMWAGGRVIV